MKFILKWLIFFIKWLIILSLLLVILSLILFKIKEPLNNRDWEFGQQKLQQVIINDNKIEIKDLRNYDWTKKGQEEKYQNFNFDLDQIKNLEVGVSHFSAIEGIGHVFLVFNLDDGRNFALSVESRRSKGEKFSLLKGLTFDYEIIYILSTREDLLSLRESRDERVYLYPIKTDKSILKSLFLEVASKVNSLYKKPEFYHLFLANCTNTITREVEKVSERKFPFWEKTFAPGNTGRALFKMNLVEMENSEETKSFEKAREKFLISFD